MYNIDVRNNKQKSKHMNEKMKECFNYWATKIIGSETLNTVVTDLYHCYYKYNGYEYANDRYEILDALSPENLQALADRVTEAWELDEETQLQALYDITATELKTNREA